MTGIEFSLNLSQQTHVAAFAAYANRSFKSTLLNYVTIYLLGFQLKAHQAPVVHEERSVSIPMPYWARELLRMWEEVERWHKARRPSSREAF